MAGTARGRLEGREMAEQFRRISRNAENEIERALVSAGAKVVRDAKINCPVNTGRLQNSIAWRLIDEGNKSVVEVGTNVFYAKFIEYGTSRMPAKPFLVPAFLQNRARIQQLINTAIERALRGG